MFKPTVKGLILGLLIAFSGIAYAQLTIEITGGHEAAIPIAIVPFSVTRPVDDPASEVDRIVVADLERSGRFRAFPEKDMISKPSQPTDVDYRTWQALGPDYVVIGQARETGLERYEVKFYLFDVFKRQQISEYSIPGTRANLRRVAHKISDLIYEKIIGKPGAFSSQVAYVTDAIKPDKSREFKLQVADADGFNPQTILTSREPIMSPAWSPNGNRLAYVSFEKQSAAVYIQSVASGSRYPVATYPGINGAPAWSPDGNQLALTLSKDGNPEIYILDLNSGALRRLTNNFSIDTEAAWTPDGKQILFTSDRGGTPQIYQIGVADKQVRRLTFEGNYNAAASISPDGKLVALVHGAGGQRYRIAVLDRNSGNLTELTDGGMDESPSFAPNGSMILYATRQGGREQLSAVSVDGNFSQQLVSHEGGVREPAWAPVN